MPDEYGLYATCSLCRESFDLTSSTEGPMRFPSPEAAREFAKAMKRGKPSPLRRQLSASLGTETQPNPASAPFPMGVECPKCGALHRREDLTYTPFHLRPTPPQPRSV